MIGNIGSYVAEYIGVYGEDLFDRSVEELAADPGRSVSEACPEQDGWELDGIGIVDRDGEPRHEVENTGVEYIQIDGAEHPDPPKKLPPDRPTPNSTESTLRADE
ncbi:hypothetical protein [Haloplanus halobius]|uniref:hypothetical protein n=1 Tax=Haloplanus halobius TaxID=2934938 RepID=UPI00200F72B0|nr:hypothetical protein [Haloplanus sp. XH21]